MRWVRFLVLSVMLIAMLTGLSWTFGAYSRYTARMRAQPLVTLIENEQRMLPGTPYPGLPPPTSKTMEAADTALVPKVRACLSRGITPNAWGQTEVSYNGQQQFTPLMVAAMRRLPNTARVLIQAGANVNTVDQDGRTALIWAVKSGNSRVLSVLLAKGADPNIVDRRGRTAIDYAYFDGGGWDRREALLRILKRIRAKPGPYAQRHQNPYQRFTLTNSRTGRLSSQCSGDGIRFHSDAVLDFPESNPPFLTRIKEARLHSGMTYPEVSTVLGVDETGGEMMPDYEGTFTFTQGKRRIWLVFQKARVIWKWSSGL